MSSGPGGSDNGACTAPPLGSKPGEPPIAARRRPSRTKQAGRCDHRPEPAKPSAAARGCYASASGQLGSSAGPPSCGSEEAATAAWLARRQSARWTKKSAAWSPALGSKPGGSRPNSGLTRPGHHRTLLPRRRRSRLPRSSCLIFRFVCLLPQPFCLPPSAPLRPLPLSAP